MEAMIGLFTRLLTGILVIVITVTIVFLVAELVAFGINERKDEPFVWYLTFVVICFSFVIGTILIG